MDIKKGDLVEVLGWGRFIEGDLCPGAIGEVVAGYTSRKFADGTKDGETWFADCVVDFGDLGTYLIFEDDFVGEEGPGLRKLTEDEVSSLNGGGV